LSSTTRSSLPAPATAAPSDPIDLAGRTDPHGRTDPAGAPARPGSPLEEADLRARVDHVLRTFLDRQDDVLAAVSPDCHELVASVRDLVTGGKRLRPAFCYWGWRGAGGPDGEAIVRAAAALELFQAAALIHDDVMDDSDTRRGMPAVHRRFAGLHRGRSWREVTGEVAGRNSDDERFGLAGAVLTGDMCLCWSDELFAGSGLEPRALAAGRTMFDRMRTELLGGQYLDVLAQAAPEPSPQEAVERARRVIRFKSAKYTIEHPLLIGGLLAGAEPALLESYSAYGLALGEAFQLRDDVLGVFGDPDRTGKPAGDDLREGKRTVLVALTLQAASPAQAQAVRRHLGDPGLGTAGVDEVRAIMVDTGALDGVERMIADLAAQARATLAASRVPDPARQVLGRLVTATTARAQ
jgi:geranylgeranyl diphosphate synthase type I